MHAEQYSVPPEAARIVGVPPRRRAGTTVARTLETWAATGEAEGESDSSCIPATAGGP